MAESPVGAAPGAGPGDHLLFRRLYPVSGGPAQRAVAGSAAAVGRRAGAAGLGIVPPPAGGAAPAALPGYGGIRRGLWLDGAAAAGRAGAGPRQFCPLGHSGQEPDHQRPAAQCGQHRRGICGLSPRHRPVDQICLQRGGLFRRDHAHGAGISCPGLRAGAGRAVQDRRARGGGGRILPDGLCAEQRLWYPDGGWSADPAGAGGAGRRALAAACRPARAGRSAGSACSWVSGHNQKQRRISGLAHRRGDPGAEPAGGRPAARGAGGLGRADAALVPVGAACAAGFPRWHGEQTRGGRGGLLEQPDRQDQ